MSADNDSVAEESSADDLAERDDLADEAEAADEADLLDVELGARWKDLAQDQVTDRPVYSLAQALVQERGDRGAGRRRSRGRHGAVFLAPPAAKSIGFSFDT